MSKANGKPEHGGGLHKALTHPLRTRILLAIQRDGVSSPVRFSAGTKDTGSEVSLNVAAYHFRVLVKYEVIELRDEVQRRGATEHVYGINPGSPVPDMIGTTDLLDQLRANADSGKNADGTGVSVLPIEIDNQGQEELNEMMSGIATRVEEISEGCRERLEADEEPARILRVGLALLAPEDDVPSATTASGD